METAAGFVQAKYDDYHFHELIEQPQILLMRSIKVKYRRERSPYWLIVYDMAADDGLKIWLTDLEINQFDGVRKIQDLAVYLLEYAPNSARIKSKLIARGKKYVRMVGHTFWETSGPALREIVIDRYRIDHGNFGVSQYVSFYALWNGFCCRYLP